MKGMQPLKNKEDIQKIYNELRRNKTERDYILALIGFNTGLRIGDIVKLKVEDIYNKDYLNLITEKEKTMVNIYIKNIKEDIKIYVDDNNLNNLEYLFPSRQVDGDGIRRNISETQAARIMKEVFDKLGFNKCNTHTFRKTFAHHFYKLTRSIKLLSKALGHKNENVTRCYLDITQEDIDKSYVGFYL